MQIKHQLPAKRGKKEKAKYQSFTIYMGLLFWSIRFLSPKAINKSPFLDLKILCWNEKKKASYSYKV